MSSHHQFTGMEKIHNVHYRMVMQYLVISTGTDLTYRTDSKFEILGKPMFFALVKSMCWDYVPTFLRIFTVLIREH